MNIAILELKIPPPVVLLVCAAINWLLSQAAPSLTYPKSSAVIVVSIILACCGVLLAVAGVISFHKARTTIHPYNPRETSSIVVSGVYAVTRNPMYAGLLLLLTACIVYVWNPLGILTLVAFIFYITRFQIIPEERILKSKFGSEYEQYLQKVRRWI